MNILHDFERNCNFVFLHRYEEGVGYRIIRNKKNKRMKEGKHISIFNFIRSLVQL